MQAGQTPRTEKRTDGPRSPVAKIAILAVSTALVFVVTRVVTIPISITGIPSQEFDFGDIMVFTFAWTFGPAIGGFAGGVGSAISDVTLGGLYAPFTLVVKGTEGLLAGFIARKGGKRGQSVSWLLASIAMVGGYFITNLLFIGVFVGDSLTFDQRLLGASWEVPFDIAQVVAGGVIGRYASSYLKTQLPGTILSGSRKTATNPPGVPKPE